MKTALTPTHSLIRIRKSATLQDAAHLMCDMSMGALGVDDDGHQFQGLITERDLIWAVAQGKDPCLVHVEEIMNHDPVIVEGPITLTRAAQRMRAAHVRHLIVRSPGGPLRIVSIRDLLETFEGPADEPVHAASAAELHRMFGTPTAI